MRAALLCLLVLLTVISLLPRTPGLPGATNPWWDAGGGLTGVFGVPMLSGSGSLQPGTPGTLYLNNAWAHAPAMLFVSLASTPTNFKCGTLVPVSNSFQLAGFTGVGGFLQVGWGSWPILPSGLNLYFQYAIQDPTAICGVSISNVLIASLL